VKIKKLFQRNVIISKQYTCN